jgi:hypothetical protein
LLLFWPGSRFGADLHPEALRLLEEAIARNPGYGLALAWAAICCVALDTILGWQAQNAAFRPKMCEGGLLEGPRMVVAGRALSNYGGIFDPDPDGRFMHSRRGAHQIRRGPISTKGQCR